MDDSPLEILYEDNHLLAVVKPAGLATMGTPGGTPTLLDVARRYIKQQYDKPGNVYLGVVSRLDAPTTGVVLLARTSKAARRLTEQFRERTVRKSYRVLVEGAIRQLKGECVDWVAPDKRHRRMRIVGRTLPDAKEARLAYRRLSVVEGNSLLEVDLLTGRKHQIRLQMAHAGHPVVGDRKYGSVIQFPAGIALHAHRLIVLHPVEKTPVELVAPIPEAWGGFGIRA